MKADTSKLPVEIRSPHRNEYLAVEAFYRTRNYTTPIADDDYVLAVFEGNVVVGAVRLCNESETLVLRGMQVSDTWQGRGVGIFDATRS